MRMEIFIAIFLSVAVYGFTSETFASNHVATQLEKHDTDIKTDLGTLDGKRKTEHDNLESKIDQLLSIATPLQREYSSLPKGNNIMFDIGTFTVPRSKRLVIEFITARVPGPIHSSFGFAYPISVITTVDGSTIEHSVGSVYKESAIAIYIGSGLNQNSLESFPVVIYADPNTKVIFRTTGLGSTVGILYRVTFSGRLIDVP